jgi:hypothetical protein
MAHFPVVKRYAYRWARMLGLLILALGMQGCYHYPVTAPDPDPATDYERRTVHAYVWGLVQEDVRATDCVSNALDEVRVTTNLGYLAASVATLGIWVPLQLEWRCAKKPPPDGKL